MNIIQTLEQSSFIFLFSIGILGLIIGSFINVVVYRLPVILQRSWREDCFNFLDQKDPKSESSDVLSLSQPNSRCPLCKHAISAIENIPIFSYIFLKGRCRSCHSPIAIRYPLVELSTAILSIVIAVNFGVTIQTSVALLFTWVLISLTLIDFDTQLLPDLICFPLLWFALFVSLFNIFTDPQSAIIGALAGYLTLWGVFWAFKLITGKEGMGYGDFKLHAAIGALLGWQMLPLVILLSAFVGAFIGIMGILINGRDKNIPMPFGPYLSIAAFIALIWGNEINNTYLQFTGL